MADDGLTEADALDMPELRAEQLDLSGFLEPKASSAEACNELLQPSEPELSGASELEVTRQRHELRPGRKMRRPGVRLAADDTPQTANLAPMLRQYLQIKREYPEHLLLFQVGDFYEIFFDDAKTAANFLQIRLTSRDKESPDPVPMCGVPVHALDNYLPRLLKGGYSCVIVSQAEDAKDKKGMVRREISRIVTPGIRYEGDGLDEKQFNYLAAVCVAGGDGSGAVCYVDVSTGHLRVQETESVEELTEVLERIRPAELLLPSLIFSVAAEKSQPWLREVRRICGASGCRVVQRPFDRTTKAEVQKRMGGLFPKTGENGAAGMIAQNTARLSPVALSVVQTLVGYVEEVSFGSSASMSQFSIEEPRRSVFIDAATRRNLEICETRLDGDRRNSLLYHIDYSRTPMGTRLLADWLLVPSANRSELEARYDALEELMHESGVLEELRSLLAAVRDVDRLLSRITSGRASPRDLSALGESLAVLPVVRRCCSGFAAEMLREVLGQIDALEDIQQQISAALVDEPPVRINEGGILRDGFHNEVDRLRRIRTDGHLWLAALEEKERKRTGISGLKVRYNNVFGYFIEVTKTHLHKIPADFERRQTLVNAERFVTRELKDYEANILSAKAKLFELERELFCALRTAVAAQACRIQQTSRALSVLDVLCSFAHLALSHNFSRPVLSEDGELEIREGRHPVVERVIGSHNFVSNDTVLQRRVRQFAVLTGPNMGGKSTYLRQIGLIQLLAQAGSFVPAKSAKLPLVDRIFTRIGAADDLTRGDSTFMVEMKEAAAILRKASSRSLVLIDEVGRGTATMDGLALATAISEWLHDRIGCFTIFATHFHELTRLAGLKDGIFCLSVGVLEKEDEIIFTHRIEERAADRSYGIEVARLAGLPEGLLQRAQVLLEHLEGEAQSCGSSAPALIKQEPLAAAIERTRNKAELDRQSSLCALRDRLRACNPNMMTPLQALQEVAELRKLAEEPVE